MSVPQRRIELSLVSAAGVLPKTTRKRSLETSRKDEPATEKKRSKRNDRPATAKKVRGKDGETWKQGRKIEVRTEESALDVGNSSKRTKKNGSQTPPLIALYRNAAADYEGRPWRPALQKRDLRESQPRARLRNPLRLSGIYLPVPLTGQPDFAHFRISYVPDELCIELKSLKLYLWSFRDEGAFHEKVTNQIADDIISAIRPRKLRVEGDFAVRNGIGTVVVIEHQSG